ncbi:MAG: xthA [Microbacterium sp.]|nr:xthA [Microbacterium sp.]
MRLATWNVNSIRARVTRTVEFCVREHIDVLARRRARPEPVERRGDRQP